MRKLNVVFHLIIACAVSFMLASIFHTQAVLSRLVDIGIIIPLNLRLQTLIDDFVGLAPSYGLILFVGLSIAFFVASLLLKKRSLSVIAIYTTAGFCAVLTVLIAMHPILHITFLAGARTYSGVMLQCIAGGIGGLLFGWLARYRTKPDSH